MTRAIDDTGGRGEPPGLQVERTVLAWDRTALAVLVNAALLLVRDVRSAGAGALTVAVLALVGAIAVAVLGRHRARRLGVAADRGQAARRELAVVGMGVVAVGVGVLIVLVLALAAG